MAYPHRNGELYQPSNYLQYSHEVGDHDFATHEQQQQRLVPQEPPSYPLYANSYPDAPSQHFIQHPDYYSVQPDPYQPPPPHHHPQAQPFLPHRTAPRSSSTFPPATQFKQDARPYEHGTAGTSMSDASSPSSSTGRSGDGLPPFASSSRTIPVAYTTVGVAYPQSGATEKKVSRVGKEKEGHIVTDSERQGRKSNSCAPCRKRKTRCDRCSPCSSCTARGDIDSCTWEDATPLYSLRTDNDVKELKDQVLRLQGLVDSLTGHLQSSSGLPSPGSDSKGARASAEAEEIEVDMRAGDLCAALSQLAIAGVIPEEPDVGLETFGPGGISGDRFIQEARQFVATYSERTGAPDSLVAPPHTSPASTPSLPTPPPWHNLLASLHTKLPTVSDIVAFLPTVAESDACITFYIHRFSWFQHAFNVVTFRQKWDDLTEILALPPDERDLRIDLSFVATFFAACAGGIDQATLTSTSLSQLGQGYESLASRRMLYDKWTKGAMLALVAAQFVEAPNIETIRAATIITTHSLWISPGESSGAALGLLSIAVQGAFTIGLHRDPSRSKRFSFLESEDRRSVFWNLFSQCMTSTWIFGRSWPQFDLSLIDCAMPLDCHDEELHQDERATRAAVSRRASRVERERSASDDVDETDMTVLIYKAKVALLTKKSDDAAFGIKPVKHSVILDLHRQLKEIESSLPIKYRLDPDEAGIVHELGDVFKSPHSPTYTKQLLRAAMIQVILAMGFVRIHRPWLVLGGSDERYLFSRTMAVKYAKRLVAMHASPTGIMNLGGHNYKTLSCAILLAVEMLQTPDEAEAQVLHQYVTRAVANLSTWKDSSTICRKGVNVLHFLLRKRSELRQKALQPRDAKRARTSSATTATSASHPLFDTFTWSPDYLAQPQDDLRHKSAHAPLVIPELPTPRRIAQVPVRDNKEREFWNGQHGPAMAGGYGVGWSTEDAGWGPVGEKGFQ